MAISEPTIIMTTVRCIMMLFVESGSMRLGSMPKSASSMAASKMTSAAIISKAKLFPIFAPPYTIIIIQLFVFVNEYFTI